MGSGKTNAPSRGGCLIGEGPLQPFLSVSSLEVLSLALSPRPDTFNAGDEDKWQELLQRNVRSVFFLKLWAFSFSNAIQLHVRQAVCSSVFFLPFFGLHFYSITTIKRKLQMGFVFPHSSILCKITTRRSAMIRCHTIAKQSVC